MRKIHFVCDLIGAVVIDNCATIQLKSGEQVTFAGIVNPEWQGKREFIEYDYWIDDVPYMGESIELPLMY